MPDMDLLSYPLRHSLNDEAHARPSDPISTPSRLTYIANLSGPDSTRGDDFERLSDLMQKLGAEPPSPGAKHVSVQLDGFRLRWEGHTEFSRYGFTYPHVGGLPFQEEPLQGIPQDWLESLEKDLLVGVHLYLLPMPAEGLDVDTISRKYFDGNVLLGSMIADGHAAGLTDFRIREDGFTRYLILNESLPDARAGRYVQRLLEIETYRMMALLALPVAQQLLPQLTASEQELAEINKLLVGAQASEERDLLERLTILAAANQGRHAATNFRFSASDAYYDLVLERNKELRQGMIPGTQSFTRFATRRLTPAIKTSRAAANRLQSLVAQMARSTQLLSTRIDVERQGQNQGILESVNRRLESQLRLQATVEGLSVAAVTYYTVGLIAFVAKGLEEKGLVDNALLITAAAVPVVAITIYLLVRRVRKRASVGVPE